MNEEQSKQFGRWWFVNGGMLHPLWKRRRYSKILALAKELPQRAFKVGWEAGYRAAREEFGVVVDSHHAETIFSQDQK